MTVSMRKVLLFLLVATITLTTHLRAGEGMWLPLLLEQLNEAEMQAMGMKLSAEDIYSVNQGSLKDAIVHFGGFCTGEVISSQGLVLTNHHCGYGQIQYHSSLEKNYLRDGFWAPNQAGELPNPGLFVTFIVRMEDVTKNVLAEVTDEMNEKERQAAIDRALTRVKDEARREDYQDVLIRPFYHGNQFFLFVTETYRDIRLVGAPPSSIGKFGADTDNWVWPRHTGDFSLFRIYAGPDNKPADYSPDNQPYQPRHHLPISLDGVEVDDFTLVFGFPGRTDQYLPAVAMQQRVDVLNPIRIGIRDQSLAILDKAMRADPAVRIQYASKQSRIANSWKKWLGESQGIDAYGGIARKLAIEAEFTERINENPEWRDAYGDILPSFAGLYQEIEPYAITRDYVSEITFRNIELFQLANRLYSYLRIYESNGPEAFGQRLESLKNYLESFYKDYRPEIDQEITAALLTTYFREVKAPHQAPYAVQHAEYVSGDFEALADLLFQKSFLAKPEVAQRLLEQNPEGFFQQLKGDFAYEFVRAMITHNEEVVLKPYEAVNDRIDLLQRRYMAALMEVFPTRRFYPDANNTMRVTYGKVQGYEPRDAVSYDHLTYLDGVIEKYVPGDYEFDVPEKLLQLYKDRDFGQYAAANGQMPVCFIGSNHTTGGNSGSPAIDAEGNLIGLNFDRTWEGTMSDINYDLAICRNIMVDVRYILFIIDKFAGAEHLIEELTLVHPKE